ncbi:MAG: hypothetical protein M1404_02205 [Acidobacteria bacterium]|nr:hypothetical protein [Acidobacteriota bacterium]
MIHTIRSSRIFRQTLTTLALAFCLAGWAFARPPETPVPVVNANLGPCTVDFTVSQSLNHPIFNAQISVRIAYGFLGMKKMNLQIGTNSEGKARFEGLPTNVHNPPLTFVVKYNGMTKSVHYWPAVRCHAQYAVIMGGG